MECNAATDLIEELAVEAADVTDARLAAHLQTCARCRARLSRARAIHAVLAARPTPQPPAHFTTDVMARIRHERWRAEQWLDTGFNIAVVTGVLFIGAGVAGLLWASGIAAVGGDLASLAAAGTSVMIDRLARDAQNVMLAVVFFGVAAAAWWWMENDAVF